MFVCALLSACAVAVFAACNPKVIVDPPPGQPGQPGQGQNPGNNQGTDPISDPLEEPDDLYVYDVTETSAMFTWEGVTESYEICIGEVVKTIQGTTHTESGLTVNTTYKWKVRAKDGDRYSEWVDGLAFETGVVMTHRFALVTLKPYGGEGVKNYYLSLYDQHMVESMNGFKMMLDLYAPGGSDTVMPDGEYTVGTADAWGVDPAHSALLLYMGGSRDREHKVAKGTLNVTSTGENTYDIVMAIETEDGVKVNSKYSGEVDVLDYE